MDGDASLTDAAAAVKSACWWCGTEFNPRNGGSPQRFCKTKCRDAFHSAGRRWAEMAVLSGVITVGDLMPLGRRTLVPATSCRSSAPARAQGAHRDVVPHTNGDSVKPLEPTVAVRGYAGSVSNPASASSLKPPML